MSSLRESERLAEYSATLQNLLAGDSQRLVPALIQASPLVASTVGADLVDAFLYNPPSDALITVSTPHSQLAERQHQRRLDALPLSEGGLVAKVFREGSTYLTGRADEDPSERQDIVRHLGLASLIFCRIQTQNQPVGVLRAASTHAEQFASSDVTFIEAVARWAGLVAGQEALAGQAQVQRKHERASYLQLRRITARELEVATLVAEGLTNDEIAARLVVSTGTVSNHVEHILRKLNFSRRVQIATWIVRQGDAVR